MNATEKLERRLGKERIKVDFRKQLKEVRPQLFSMADQLMAAQPERWDAMWVDDKGGRLVGLFMHRVFKEAGMDIPTFFVMAGSKARANRPPNADDQFARLVTAKKSPQRGLIVADTVIKGHASGYLASNMKNYFEQVDVAAVASKIAKPEYLDGLWGDTFFGGVGNEAVLRSNAAFESVLFNGNTPNTMLLGHLKNIVMPTPVSFIRDHDHTYPVSGVDTLSAENSIHAQRAPNAYYRDATVFARKQISAMAVDYTVLRRPL